jgi:hypothetical protein
VLGTRDDDNNLVAEQLTVDLKPNLPSMVSLSLSLKHDLAANVALKLKEMYLDLLRAGIAHQCTF